MENNSAHQPKPYKIKSPLLFGVVLFVVLICFVFVTFLVVYYLNVIPKSPDTSLSEQTIETTTPENFKTQPVPYPGDEYTSKNVIDASGLEIRQNGKLIAYSGTLKSINSNDLSILRGNATKTVSLLESTPFVLYTEDLANKKSVSSTISLEDLQLGDEITINLDASGSVVRVAVVRYVK